MTMRQAERTQSGAPSCVMKLVIESIMLTVDVPSLSNFRSCKFEGCYEDITTGETQTSTIASENGRETFVVVGKLFVLHSRQKSSTACINEVSIVIVSDDPIWLLTLNQI